MSLAPASASTSISREKEHDQQQSLRPDSRRDPGRCVFAGCSGTTEDVRVTLCKNLTQSLLPSAQSIEWTGNENTFVRPEFAVTGP